VLGGYERRHKPIAVADAWIAATALVHGYELVTHNAGDFHGIRGLSVITEAAP
jgi:predicted nucleic acid-binding protein